MKKMFLRTGLALACAAGLAACGGNDDGDLLLRVFINNLTKDGLTLSNNGGTALPVAAGSTFFDFPNLIAADSDFDIKVVTSPSNAVCTIYNGTGKSGTYAPQGIRVDCITKLHSLKASVTGLTGPLVVVNGNVRFNIPAGTTVFDFTTYDAEGKPVAGQVGDGQSYTLQVLTQPTGQTCTIANGTGVMGETDVTNIAIDCRPNPTV